VDTVIKPFLTQPGANSVAIKDPSILIVTDYASNILRVGKLVQLMDRPKPDVVMEFVTVKNMEAGALSQQLSSLVTARAKATGAANGATSVEITNDARTNQLMLVGTRSQVDDVLRLAESLDVTLGLSTQVYALRYTSADRVERLAKELLDPVDAKRLFKSAVDTDGNLLIVTGTPRIHEQVAAIQRRLDVPVAQSKGFVGFYKLKNVKASEVLDTIRAMDGKSSAGDDHPTGADAQAGGARNQPAQAGNAPRGIAGGLAAGPGGALNGGMGPAGGGMAAAAGGMGQGGAPGIGLAGAGQAAGQAMGRAGPGGGHAAEKASSVELNNARITADPNTNSIIVVAEPAMQEMYGELILSLDRRRPQLLIEAYRWLGQSRRNALAAVDEVFIPLPPHFLALHGLSKLLETIDLVARRLNPRLRLSGVVLCMFMAPRDWRAR
jgi:general secretion pathway protein D